MRNREDIKNDADNINDSKNTTTELQKLQLEVLLDIRDQNEEIIEHLRSIKPPIKRNH